MSNPISLKLRRVFFEQKWERSCFFGNPDIPIIYLRIIEDDEFFFAQINLEEVTKVYNSYKKLPCLFLDEETKYEEMFDDEIILLKYDQRNNTKISLTDGIILFVIRKEDLIQRNYEAVRMIIVH